MRKTIVQHWTKDWEAAFLTEMRMLVPLMHNQLVDIFHIGSTSIPTIGYAKPIIDILLIVKDINKEELFHEELALLGYMARGENGILGRRYFTKGNENRTHHLHMYQAGHENIAKHLNFKAYLMAHPLEAKEYGELKVKLAKQFLDNTHAYQADKEKFVVDLMRKVEMWTS